MYLSLVSFPGLFFSHNVTKGAKETNGWIDKCENWPWDKANLSHTCIHFNYCNNKNMFLYIRWIYEYVAES